MDDSDLNSYVNPELPPEMANIHNEDLIGGTLFGKHDLFEILLLLIKVSSFLFF